MIEINKDISNEEKLFGLYQVWSRIKFEYSFPEKVESIAWDNLVMEYSKKVLKTKSIKEYYFELMRFASNINDGHTGVIPPWIFNVPNTTNPPFEVGIKDNRFYVVRVGESENLIEKGIVPGTEILKIDGVDAFDYFESINKIYARGSLQANNIINMYYLLSGEIGSTLVLKVKDNNCTKDVEIIRNNDVPFVHSLTNWDPAIVSRIEKDKLIIKITTFEDSRIVPEFDKIIESINNSVLEVVLDLRSNLGGKDSISNHVISRFIDKEAQSPIWKFRNISPALRKWGHEEKWDETYTMIQPFDGKRYLGKLSILCNGGTSSSAEDIAIALKYAGRAKIIGEKTAGSAGNPLITQLPGGGMVRVSTFRALTPKKEEYVGIGIDVDSDQDIDIL